MEECSSCGEGFSRITSHWAQSDCGYPELTEKQKKMCIGLLMGDADVQRPPSGYPSLRLRMTNQEFLESIKNEFGPLATDINLEISGDEALENNKKSETIPVTENSEYKDLYRIVIRANPWFKNLSQWYESGEKVWPSDTDFSPVVVKMWYVCDGWYDNSTSRPSIRANNESSRLKAHINKLKENGMQPHKRTNRDIIRFNKSKAEEFFDYIGDPPDGFEYKWPNRND